MSERAWLRTDRLSVAEKDGLFWAVDWVANDYGNMVFDRYHISFKTKRDAEAFVKAAKRSIAPTPKDRNNG